MSILVIMSQPLRGPQAAAFLHSREPEERKLLVTRDVGLLDEAMFPAGTEFRSWEVSAGLPSAITLSSRLITKAKTWVRSGSRLGTRVERWLKAGEWRLRYLDRVMSVAHGGRSAEWSEARLRAFLEVVSEAERFEEAVVFDLFDLPALIPLSESRSWRMRVL